MGSEMCIRDSAITFTQALTLDASGNLGVGTTSPAARIDADGNIRSVGTTQNRSVLLTTNAGTFEIAQRTDVTATLINSTATPIIINTGGANYLSFGTNATERARIDSSGNLLVGTTSTTGSSSNTARVVGGIFNSFRGEISSAATNTSYTMFDIGANYACYIVSVIGVSADAVNYSATAVVNMQNTSVSISYIAVSYTHLTLPTNREV